MATMTMPRVRGGKVRFGMKDGDVTLTRRTNVKTARQIAASFTAAADRLEREEKERRDRALGLI